MEMHITGGMEKGALTLVKNMSFDNLPIGS